MIYFCCWIRNCTHEYSDKKAGSSTSEGSIAGIAISISSVENGMLQLENDFNSMTQKMIYTHSHKHRSTCDNTQGFWQEKKKIHFQKANWPLQSDNFNYTFPKKVKKLQ